jgi:hypothetical protein
MITNGAILIVLLISFQKSFKNNLLQIQASLIIRALFFIRILVLQWDPDVRL